MWRVEFTRPAAQQFAKLDANTQRDISDYLDRLLLAADPLTFGKPLVGDLGGFWRYRVGKYRLICDIQAQCLLIEVIRIGKRDQVYG